MVNANAGSADWNRNKTIAAMARTTIAAAAGSHFFMRFLSFPANTQALPSQEGLACFLPSGGFFLLITAKQPAAPAPSTTTPAITHGAAFGDLPAAPVRKRAPPPAGRVPPRLVLALFLPEPGGCASPAGSFSGCAASGSGSRRFHKDGVLHGSLCGIRRDLLRTRRPWHSRHICGLGGRQEQAH